MTGAWLPRARKITFSIRYTKSVIDHISFSKLLLNLFIFWLSNQVLQGSRCYVMAKSWRMTCKPTITSRRSLISHRSISSLPSVPALLGLPFQALQPNIAYLSPHCISVRENTFYNCIPIYKKRKSCKESLV